MGSHQGGVLRHRAHGAAAAVVVATAAGLTFLAYGSRTLADDAQGAQIAATCAACHTSVGDGQGIASIVGLDAEKISRAILAYKVSERPSHVMHAIALSLSEEELASVARYFAGQKKEPLRP
jgi:cytochrome c553